MEMAFRWYGDNDPVTLQQIRQIPGVVGIVSALHDVPAGEKWSMQKILELKNKVEAKGFDLSVIESVPVHEDIKLGKDTRDKYIENYKTTIKRLGEAGIKIVCYNFMPVFDWTRSELEYRLADGSTTLKYVNSVIEKMEPVSILDFDLPAWNMTYTKESLGALLDEYKEINEEKLWENLRYFLEKIIPVAEEVGIKMAIHPDDPPWSIFGLPRLITNEQNIERFLALVASSSNGLALCSGSLGSTKNNDVPKLIRKFGERLYFLHLRNVKITGDKSFEEAAHLSSCGSLDMVEILKACKEVGFDGPVRPDHGRMIWGEKGTPGYGLYDRALGAAYLNGIIETLGKIENK